MQKRLPMLTVSETEKKIKNMIESHAMINDGDNILVALSGGSDSCALLFFLFRHYPNRKKNMIYAAHLNHMIRGNDADRDEEFVRNLCRKYNIKLFVEKANIPEIVVKTKKTLEEAARDERYAFFDRVCSQIGGNIKIATAHNASDNTETVIFNISRGCGIEGLRGIAPMFGNIIRPLLDCTKSEISEYCKQNDILYVEDVTNADEAYTRNFIRHSIAAMLRTRFGKLDKNIRKMTELVRTDAEFIDKYADGVMRDNKIINSVSVDFLLTMDKTVRTRIIMKMYGNASERINADRELEYRHIAYIIETIEKRKNIKINLPENIVAEVLYGVLTFKQNRSIKSFEKKYNQPLSKGKNAVSGIDMMVCVDIINGFADRTNYTDKLKIDKSSENVYNLFNHAYFDFDKIIGRIYIRNRCVNDEYVFFGQTKSVKKNYINYKVPADIRDILPILYDDSGILWACGLPVGDRVRITDNTDKIMKVTVDISV